MRPRPRSRTKSKSRPTSRLKRKNAGEDKPKPSRSAKLPRTNSASALADSPSDLAVEPLYGLLSEVPQSMLFSFQVVPSPSQTYNVECSSSSVPDAVPFDTDRFASTGPEPMFDHSWRIAFVEARIPIGETRLPQFASDQTICAESAVLEQRRDMPYSGSLASVSPPSQSLTPPLLRYTEPLDRDASPRSLGSNVELVATYGRPAHGNEVTEYPSHCHPSVLVHLSHVGDVDAQHFVARSEHCTALPSPNGSDRSLLQQHTSGPPPWSPLYASPFVPSFHPPAPLPSILPSSLFSFPSGLSSFPECDMGSISQRKHSVPSFRESPEGHFLQPSLSTLRSETHGCDTSGTPYLDLRLPPLPPLTSFPTYQPLPSLGFAQGFWTSNYPASHHTTRGAGARTTHPSPSGMPNVLCNPHGPPLPYSGIQPAPSVPIPSMPLPVLQPTPCVPSPWCTLFDNLKRRTQADPGAAKKKRRTSALIPERTAHEAGQPGLNDVGDDEQEQRLHPCPLCPRVFSLPNSLALHLKWHWGASGLEWKRGELPRRVCVHGVVVDYDCMRCLTVCAA